MLLFMLLAGKPPFEGDHEVAIIESIQRNKITFEKKFWADKPEAKKLIKNMLASAVVGALIAACVFLHLNDCRVRPVMSYRLETLTT